MLRSVRAKQQGIAVLRVIRRAMTRKRAAAEAARVAAAPAAKLARILQVAEEDESSHTSPGSDVLLRYEGGLVTAQLLRRYKRFLGDVQLGAAGSGTAQPPGEEAVVHVPNTGPMTGLLDSLPAPVLMSCSSNAKRKHAHTLEWIRPEPQGTWVGVHSAKANAMVKQLLAHRKLPGLPPYHGLQTEVKYGSDGRSRVDFVLHGAQGAATHVEVKSVTLAEDLPKGAGRIALFPDTVSARAQRHVRELTALAHAGGAAALVFAVQRGDCAAFAPCHAKDPEYGRLVMEAAGAGVAVLAVTCRLDEEAGVVRFAGTLPVRLDHGL